MPKLNLAEMAQGAFIEQFARELDKVLENIADPNTDALTARKITLTATIKADENRELATFTAQCKSTLVPPKAQGTVIIIDRDNDGKVVGAELKSGSKGQLYLDGDSKIKNDVGDEVGNVVNLKR